MRPGAKLSILEAIRASPPLAKHPIPKSRTSLPATLLGLRGVGGLIGLLAPSTHYPRQAFVLRALAIAWFLTIGAIKFVIDLRAPTVRSGRGVPATPRRDSVIISSDPAAVVWPLCGRRRRNAVPLGRCRQSGCPSAAGSPGGRRLVGRVGRLSPGDQPPSSTHRYDRLLAARGHEVGRFGGRAPRVRTKPNQPPLASATNRALARRPGEGGATLKIASRVGTAKIRARKPAAAEAISQ